MPGRHRALTRRKRSTESSEYAAFSAHCRKTCDSLRGYIMAVRHTVATACGRETQRPPRSGTFVRHQVDEDR